MKKLLVVLVVFLSCKAIAQTRFSEKALNDTFISLDGKELSFKEIISKHKGKKILIDVWASWCKDCIEGMPKLVALQQRYKNVVYLFLSLDKSDEEWKAGIKKYNVQGEHYFITSGWKGDFGSFVNLDWVPRYMVVDESGKIVMFKAVYADDSKIINTLK